MFSNFLVAVSREALSLASCLKNTIYNVPDGRNAPSPVTGEMTH